MREFVISDIHGAFKALKQVFQQSNFDYSVDKLFCLGDVCDGWPEVDKVFDELLKITNLVYIKGNHDVWAYEYYTTSYPDPMWRMQGGQNTILSYDNEMMPIEHLNLIHNAPCYVIDQDRLFIHGGYAWNSPIEELKNEEDFYWNRRMFDAAYSFAHVKGFKLENVKKLTPYKAVYVGHTPTLNFYNSTKPIKALEITNIDTGASYDGPLSLLDITNDVLYQSEIVEKLYPGIKARGI
jgi:serine/threonine protein phosphatase 1